MATVNICFLDEMKLCRAETMRRLSFLEGDPYKQETYICHCYSGVEHSQIQIQWCKDIMAASCNNLGRILNRMIGPITI